MFFLTLFCLIFVIIVLLAVLILLAWFREKKLFYTKDVCFICGKQTGIQGSRRYVYSDGCVCEHCLQVYGKVKGGPLLYKDCSVHDIRIDAAINAYVAAGHYKNHFQEKESPTNIQTIDGQNRLIAKTWIPRSKDEAEMVAPQLLKQASESVNLINTTKKASVFFERYDFFLDTLKKLAYCETWVRFNGNLPSDTLQNAERNRDEQIRLFILRSAQDTREKMYQLKTQRGRMNKAVAYYSIMTEYSNVMSGEHIPLFTEQYELLKTIAQQAMK